jgi:hypothetical protein
MLIVFPTTLLQDDRSDHLFIQSAIETEKHCKDQWEGLELNGGSSWTCFSRFLIKNVSVAEPLGRVLYLQKKRDIHHGF